MNAVTGAGVGAGTGVTGWGVGPPPPLLRVLVGTHCQYHGRLCPEQVAPAGQVAQGASVPQPFRPPPAESADGAFSSWSHL